MQASRKSRGAGLVIKDEPGVFDTAAGFDPIKDLFTPMECGHDQLLEIETPPKRGWVKG